MDVFRQSLRFQIRVCPTSFTILRSLTKFLRMATIRELVIANCITLGIVVVFVTCVSLEVKREFFIDGRTSASYKFKLF
jgi:hypothetical protein